MKFRSPRSFLGRLALVVASAALVSAGPVVASHSDPGSDAGGPVRPPTTPSGPRTCC